MSLQPWSWQISVYLIQLVVIFLNVCLWRHSLRSDLEGIDPEKLYLATFICQYALYCYKVWPSFFFVDECFVKIRATCHNFLGKWFTAPSGKKLPVRLCSLQCMYNLYAFCRNPKVSRNSSYRFLWNFAQQKTVIQRISSVKHFKRKCWKWRRGLKFDLELKPLWRYCQVTFFPIAQKIKSW